LCITLRLPQDHLRRLSDYDTERCAQATLAPIAVSSQGQRSFDASEIAFGTGVGQSLLDVFTELPPNERDLNDDLESGGDQLFRTRSKEARASAHMGDSTQPTKLLDAPSPRLPRTPPLSDHCDEEDTEDEMDLDEAEISTAEDLQLLQQLFLVHGTCYLEI
jgi:hypothetical protein